MSLTVDIALSHIARRRRQAAVSLVGVALGVGFFVAIAALMQGFQQYFVAKVIDVSPHVAMKDEYRTPPRQPVALRYPEAAIALGGVKPKDEPRGIKNGFARLAEIERLPGVAAAPVLTGELILRYGSKDVSAALLGIQPPRERRVSNLEGDLTAGSLDALYGSANALILGQGLADKLGVGLGDSVTALSPAGVVMKMKIVGLFETGITTMDLRQAYSLLKKAQVLQNRPNVVNEIRLRLDDVARAEAVARRLEARYGYRTESWEESNRNVLGIFVIQNAIMYSTTSAILIVAAFGIFNIVSTVVLEKTRDIAILKSIGLESHDVETIFLLQGLIVGLVGSLLGWAIGYGLIELLASVRFNIEGFMRSEGFKLERGFANYLIAAAVAILASGLAALLPARKAARVDPVEIIRGAT